MLGLEIVLYALIIITYVQHTNIEHAIQRVDKSLIMREDLKHLDAKSILTMYAIIPKTFLTESTPSSDFTVE